MPLPISRQTALKGGDVTLRFVPVKEAKGSPSIFPAALTLPTDIFIGQPAETPTPVELASYNRAVEKARRLDLQAAPENRSVDRSVNISAAALDDPGPIVSASQFTRADLPVFLLKKIDGADETP